MSTSRYRSLCLDEWNEGYMNGLGESFMTQKMVEA